MSPRRILVVNDDGVHGQGLEPLMKALSRIGVVTAVVPDGERSADSHSLTLHKPLRVLKARRAGRGTVFMVNGSPAACTRLGVLEVLKGKVDCVVSGINRGYNLGQDVLYSGTVAAAMEGTLLGLPSFSVSLGSGRGRGWAAAADFARRLVLALSRRRLPPGVCLNANLPDLDARRLRGVRVTRLGERVYEKRVTLRRDPAGTPYFWLQGRQVLGVPAPGTDVEAVHEGFVSLTPLHPDNTHLPSLSILESWGL